MDLNLAGKLALITGGSRGIGRAIGEALAAEGCNVVLVARSAADLEAARPAILSRPLRDANLGERQDQHLYIALGGRGVAGYHCLHQVASGFHDAQEVVAL